MQDGDWPSILEAMEGLLRLLFQAFGPWGSIFLIIVVLAAAFGIRVYNDKRRDREIDALIEEKDRTIQRLAESERMYRALFLKQTTDWSDEQIERFVMKNEFADPVEARKALEGGEEKGQSSSDDVDNVS